MLARQTAIVDACTSRPVDLGENFDTLAWHAGKRPTQNFFGTSACINISRVESCDAKIKYALDARVGGIFFNLTAVGDLVAVTDRRDFETAIAEISKFHRHKLLAVLMIL